MNTQQFRESLVGLSFTCQPEDRPVQTITVNAIVDDRTVNVTIVSKTSRGNVGMSCNMRLSTLAERIEAAIDHEPVLATPKAEKPKKEPKVVELPATQPGGPGKKTLKAIAKVKASKAPAIAAEEVTIPATEEVAEGVTADAE